MVEPAWKTRPVVTAAAVHPGSWAPTVRRDMTNAAATPVLMVRRVFKPIHFVTVILQPLRGEGFGRE